MGEQRSAFEAAGWVDRITTVDGTLLTKEDGVPFDEARRMAQQLEARGEGYRWERWCGERTGWNLIKGYTPEARTIEVGTVSVDTSTGVSA